MLSLTTQQLIEFYCAVEMEPLAVVDVETTGCDPRRHRITEVATIHSRGDIVESIQCTLVNAGDPVPEKIARFTGITTEMLQNAPLSEGIFASWSDQLEGKHLVGHHVRFDLEFLVEECCRYSHPLHPLPPTICTVLMARRLFPHLKSRALPALKDTFSLPVKTSHRAKDDALACFYLLRRLYKEFHSLNEQELKERFSKEKLEESQACSLLGVSADEFKALWQSDILPPKFFSRQRPIFLRGQIEACLEVRM
jgi:DNA polymerase III subunit epsilon